MKYWTFEVEKYGLVYAFFLELFWGYLIGIQYMMYQRKNNIHAKKQC